MFKKTLLKIKSLLFLTIIFFGFFALPQVLYSQGSNEEPVGYTCKIRFSVIGSTVDFFQRVANGEFENKEEIKKAYLNGNNAFQTVIAVYNENEELELGQNEIFRRFGENINMRKIFNLYTSRDYAKKVYEQQGDESAFLNEEGFFSLYNGDDFPTKGTPIPVGGKNLEDFLQKIVRPFIAAPLDKVGYVDTANQEELIASVNKEDGCPSRIRVVTPPGKKGGFWVYIFEIKEGRKVYPSDLKKNKKETKDKPQPAENVSLNPSRLDKIGAGSGGSAVQDVIGRVIKVILQVIGTVALIMFIYGGLLIMGSEGKSDRYYKGMKTMLWAALGTITILASYALVDFVLQAF